MSSNSDMESHENHVDETPSTSKRCQTRGSRRTLPSSSDSELEQDVETAGSHKTSKKNPKKRMKLQATVLPESEGPSKKRTNKSNPDTGSKRKKTCMDMEYGGSNDIIATDDGNGKEQNITSTIRSSSRQKKKVGQLASNTDSSQKLAHTASPATETQRLASPSLPAQGETTLGSQSLFSQNQLMSHPGIIKSIRLINFMCHTDFEHNFHPNLNFITGQNGSGKSALLSGILIALGGKATVTSRTTSLKTLIQKGKNSCRVAVTLLNKNGLQRYGDEIVIERWLSINGSAGYRIKSLGDWRPLKKPELNQILLGLNIQIENPVAILNQEVARSFLRSKDPKKKFSLFYDGTLLSRLETLIEETRMELNETKSILLHHKQVIDNVKNEIITLTQKCEKIAELDHIKDKLLEVKGEYLWSLVIEQEKSVGETNRSIAQVSKEMELLNEKLNKMKSENKKADEDSILVEQAQTRETLEEKQQELDTIRMNVNEARRKIANLNAKLRTIISTINSKETQINKVTVAYENLKKEQEARAKEETNVDEKRINDLQDKRKQLESCITSLQADADNFQQAGDQEREKLQDLENKARRIRAELEGKKRQVTTLSSKTTNKYAMFGAKMEELMAKVQANLHRFRRPPKGPLGACFRVKDPQYAAMIEQILWSHLDAFVVGDARDLNLLRELVDSVYNERVLSQRRTSGAPGVNIRMPGIHCMRYAEQMYDISRHHATHPQAPSILDLIEVENNDYIVMNALIDIAEIERNIIFTDNDTAAKVLKNESTVPNSLKFAYTLKWYRFTPAPRYAARVMKVKGRTEILKSGRNKQTELNVLKCEIKTLEQELKNLEPMKTEIRNLESLLRMRYNEKNQEISNMKRKIGEIMNDIKRHTIKIKEKQKQIDFTSWEEELQDLNEDLCKQLTDRDATTKELEQLKPKYTELENRKATINAEIQELTSKIASFDEAREKFNTRKIELENVQLKMSINYSISPV